MRFTWSVFIFIILPFYSFSQEIKNAEGTSFCVGFMNNEDPSEIEAITYQSLAITSRFNTHVEVEVPGSNWSVALFVPADSIVEVHIPKLLVEQETFSTVEQKGVFVYSDKPITLSALSWMTWSYDVTTIMPMSYLGNEYYTITFPTDLSGTSPPRSEYMIVGTEDNTVIQITSTSGSTSTVTLNRGSTYQFKAIDISGIKIQGAPSNGDCKPFAVFSGAQAASIPSGCLDAWDHIVEQVLPVEHLGTHHYLAPISLANNYQYKIVAVHDNTSVTINGGAAVNLNANDFVTYAGGTTNKVVVGSKPILVQQYLVGNDCGGNLWGDPASAIILPQENQINYARFGNLQTDNVDTVYLNLVIKTPHTGTVFLDGNLIDPAGFTTFTSDPTVSFARIPLADHVHELYSENMFQAYVYGLGYETYESYFYNLGWYLEPEEMAIDSALCGDGTSVILVSPPDYTTQWWSTTGAITDTLAVNDSLLLPMGPNSDIYVCHGIEATTGCTQQFRYSIEDTVAATFTINSIPSLQCKFSDIALSVSCSNPLEIYDIQWEPAIYFDDPHAFEPLLNMVETGWYKATLTSKYGDCTILKDSIYLTADNTNVLSSYSLKSEKELLCNGDSTQLNLDIYERVVFDSFNTGLDGLIWQNSSGVISSGLCGAATADALYFYGTGSRIAETFQLDLSAGGYVEMKLKSASGTGACDATETGDDLFLEYSTDNGLSWHTLKKYYQYMHHTLGMVREEIPLAAQTATTKLRLVQYTFGGLSQDIWIADDFLVETKSEDWTVDWNPNVFIDETNPYQPVVFPDQSKNYTFSVSNGGCSFTDSVYVQAKTFNAFISVDSTGCFGEAVILQAQVDSAGDYNYYWGSNYYDGVGYETSADQIFAVDSNVFEQIFYLTVVAEEGCALSDTVVIPPSWNYGFEIFADTSICLGDTSRLFFYAVEPLTDDFDNGTWNDSLWADINFGHVSDYLGAVDGQALVFDSTGVRSAETRYFNLENGGQIHYSIAYGSATYGTDVNTDASYASDYVILYCSLDSGATWFVTHVSNPMNSGFNSFKVNLPTYLWGPSVKFKWQQNGGSNIMGYNTFSLDNVAITVESEKYDYAWQLPLGTTIATGTFAEVVLDSSSYVYVVVTDPSSGCIFTDSIFIHAGPVFDPGLSDTVNCDYMAALSMVADLPASADYSFEWYDGTVTSYDSVFIFTGNLDVKQVTVKIASDEGCTVFDTALVYTPFNYRVLTILGDTAVCYEDDVALTAEVVAQHALIDFLAPEPGEGVNTSQSTGANDFYECDVSPDNVLFVRKFTSASGIRRLTLKQTSAYSTITAFEYMFGYGTGYGCDKPETGEEVFFQYSTDNGITWNDIDTLKLDEHNYIAPVYTPLPAGINPGNAILRWIQPTYTPIAGHDVWVITNIRYLSLQNTTTFSYQWEINGTPAFGDTNFVSQSVVTVPTVFHLTVTDTSGCYAEESVLVNAVQFELNAGADTALCEPNGYVLNASTTAVDPYSVLWRSDYSGNTLNNKYTLNPSMTINDTVNYVLSIDYLGCVMRDTLNITDLGSMPLPLPDTLNACNQDSVTVNLNGYSDFSWTPSTNILNAASETPVFVIDNSATYVVQYLDLNGCEGSDSLVFQVETVPQVNLIEDTLICTGDSVLLVPDINTTEIQYLWNTGVESTQLWGTAGTYWIKISNNCGAASDTIVISGFSAPVVTLPADTAICVGSQLYVIPLLTGINMELTWSDGTSDADNNLYPGVHWVIAENACGISTDTLVIAAIDLPLITLPADMTFCTFVPTLLNPAANITDADYLWNTGDVTQQLMANTPGIFWVELSNECGTSADTIELTEIPAVVNTITVSGIVLTADNMGADSYQWVDCNHGYAELPGETAVTFTPLVNGSYALILSENGCTDTSACIVINSIGIDDVSGQLKLQVYPNPVSDKFIIEFSGNEQIQITLVDLQGKMILSQTIFVSHTAIDISHLADGVYSLQVEGTNQVNIKITKL